MYNNLITTKVQRTSEEKEEEEAENVRSKGCGETLCLLVMTWVLKSELTETVVPANDLEKIKPTKIPASRG